MGDTTVFLCVGAVGREYGLHVLYQRYIKAGREILMPRQVLNELNNHARKHNQLGNAAKKVTGRGGLAKVRDRTWSAAQWSHVEDRVVHHEVRLAAARNRAPKTQDNDGEIAGILLALETDALFLTNDIAALHAAQDLGLRAATFATLLAAEVRDGRLLPEEVVRVLEPLVGLSYPGMANPTVNAIMAAPHVQGL